MPIKPTAKWTLPGLLFGWRVSPPTRLSTFSVSTSGTPCTMESAMRGAATSTSSIPCRRISRPSRRCCRWSFPSAATERMTTCPSLPSDTR